MCGRTPLPRTLPGMRNIGGPELLVWGAIIGLIPGVIAARKGHSFLGWWFFGALLFIVALPMALLVKRNRDDQQQCQYCREWIDRQATRCPKCTAELIQPVAGG